MSVSKAAENGKTTRFNNDGCQILDSKKEVLSRGIRCGNLYYLDYQTVGEAPTRQQSQQDLWHRLFGYLGIQSLRKLACEGLVKGLSYNPSHASSEIICEVCVEGKHKKTPFQVQESKRMVEPLDLVHSDVWGNLNAHTLGGSEYFLTFIDDLYPLYLGVSAQTQERDV